MTVLVTALTGWLVLNVLALAGAWTLRHRRGEALLADPAAAAVVPAPREALALEGTGVPVAGAQP